LIEYQLAINTFMIMLIFSFNLEKVLCMRKQGLVSLHRPLVDCIWEQILHELPFSKWSEESKQRSVLIGHCWRKFVRSSFLYYVGLWQSERENGLTPIL